MDLTSQEYRISLDSQVLPITIWAEKNNFNLELVNKLIGKSRELSLWRVPNITVLAHGLLTTKNGVVLDESGSSYDGSDSLKMLGARVLNSSAAVHLDGDFMCLYGRWCQGFYHWMMEWLPKAFLAEQSGFNGIYVLQNQNKFMIESLLMIGVKIERIAISPPEIWSCSNLWIAQTCHGGELEHFPELVQALRNRMLDKITPANSGGRLYITRSNPNRPRRIVNENNLIELLSKFQFRLIDMEGLPLSQQITEVAEVSALVVPHGAGAVHSMFAQKGATVIELFSPNYINPCCLAITKSLAQRYHPLVSLNLDGKYRFGEDIEAPLGLIELSLKHELEKQ